MMIGFLTNGIIKKIETIKKEIDRHFYGIDDYQFYISSQPGELKKLASEAIADGCNVLIVIGGDGSINETVNGLITHYSTSTENGKKSKTNYDWTAIGKIALGIIPSGTGNDFNRSIGPYKNIKSLAEKVRRFKLKLVDVGFASFLDHNQNAAARFFMNITDLGMGGDTVKKMQQGHPKFLSSNMKYMASIMSSFISYKKTPIRCQADNFEFTGPIMSLVVANGEYFGSGLGVAPEANLQDGMFEVIILGNITIWDYLKNIPRVRKSQKLSHKEVSYHRSNKLKIESIDGSQLPIDMDGEFAGYAPIKFKCFRKKISFLQ